MVRCAHLSAWRQADRIGRLALAMAVIAATLGGPSPLAWANAGLNVTEEIECLALTIYFEARGEPDEGKIAVGHVVMNRAQNPLFPEKDWPRCGGAEHRFHGKKTSGPVKNSLGTRNDGTTRLSSRVKPAPSPALRRSRGDAFY